MAYLFDGKTRAQILDRIRSIPLDRLPQWGKMNVAQMFAHCVLPFQVARGELEMKRTLIGRIFGGMARKRFISPEAFPRNLPTDKKFIVTGEKGAEVECERLIESVRRFGEGGDDGIRCTVHPFFGPMTPEDWDVLMWKHVDHHLRQFGV